MRKPTKKNLGDLLVQSLTEIRDGLSGARGKLTKKVVDVDPSTSRRTKGKPRK
jgi:hypothetical protein